MEADKKKIIAGVGVLGGAGLIYLLTRRRPEEEPPPGYGRVQGYVLDEETGAKIANAEISVGDIFHCYSDYHGLYRTEYVQFGTHVITVKADNYQTATFPVTLESSLMNQDLPLLPLSEAPTEWTEGVIVQKIEVSPSTAYVGETINIDVYIQYPYPLEVPADIYGTVLVNGESIRGEWTITFRNPTLRFQYTAISPGDFIVRAQDKSASFTVIQDIPATYYSPFGGVRMPACIQVTIPDVEPFDIYGQKFEGGDYLVDGFSDLKVYNVPQLIDGLQKAYPSNWNPPDAVVRNWVTKYRTWYGTWFSPSGAGLLVMATDYDCREYWDSKEELAEMIARGLGGMGIAIPDEWKLQYGTRVDLLRGLRDCVYPIRYYSLCGGGSCMPRLYCPYCDKGFDGPSHVRARPWDKESFVRSFLTHIETKHPNHPLTEPAWF